MKSLFYRHHSIIVAILLTLFTGYALLDVFVIPHEYGDAVVTPTSAVTVTKTPSRSDDNPSGQTDFEKPLKFFEDFSGYIFRR